MSLVVAPRPKEVIARVVRAGWWVGVPSLVIGWFLLAQHTGGHRWEAVIATAQALHSFLPIAAELVAEYSFTMLALALATAAAVWSHRRGTRAVRSESFFFITLLGGLESCVRVVWFARCRGIGDVPTLAEMQNELDAAAVASSVAILAPLVGAAALARWQAGGVSAAMPKRLTAAAVATVSSIVLIWIALRAVLAGPL